MYRRQGGCGVPIQPVGGLPVVQERQLLVEYWKCSVLRGQRFGYIGHPVPSGQCPNNLELEMALRIGCVARSRRPAVKSLKRLGFSTKAHLTMKREYSGELIHSSYRALKRTQQRVDTSGEQTGGAVVYICNQ